MKLTKAQRERVLEWIAEGLQSDEINKRAAKSKPPFVVSRQQVDHYRKTRDVSITVIKSEGEYSALTSGLAVRDVRVDKLQRLAAVIEDDLFNKNRIWLTQAKTVANEAYEYEEFNVGQVTQYRGLLDDIAQEVGGRSRRHELTGKDGSPLGAMPSVDLKAISEYLTDDDLQKLQDAAEIIERAQRDLATAVQKGNRGREAREEP